MPHGCGATVQASPNWATLSDTLLRQPYDGDYAECYYWIESPQGTAIEVRLVDYPWGYIATGCGRAGFELKVNRNHTLSGYRFCTPEAVGKVFRSFTNRVPLITYSSALYRIVSMELEYRYVPAA
ncbi:hypothetical protein TELCIR_09339 [Teladorsagia circumcincta]|uniref:CUB domain-containing protein n=1 Tax=Teladorsagia circumcincta TaxID=45464 RepID=A0A2G9UF47_TELCI|nr:hypothetical protein TELCIR_09339 [Teladorsagia circumcincta]